MEELDSTKKSKLSLIFGMMLIAIGIMVILFSLYVSTIGIGEMTANAQKDFLSYIMIFVGFLLAIAGTLMLISKNKP